MGFFFSIHRSYLSNLRSPTVFCHNDMQEGNILVKSSNPANENYSSDEKSSPSLLIIDYEYCAYNYRSYEIANHFIEWIFDYKVPDHPYFTTHVDNYPSLQQQVISLNEMMSNREMEFYQL